jgi:hypothetical protein
MKSFKKVYFKYLIISLAIAISFPLIAQVNLHSDIQLIRNQGFENSSLREMAIQLTDGIGPRLTGSQGFTKSIEWAVETLKNMGINTARLEPWGDFGNGWQMEKFYAAMTKPYYQPVIAVPRAWTGSTNGLVKAEVVLIVASSIDDLENYKGKLKDKIVITPYDEDLEVSFEPSAKRFSEDELLKYGEIVEIKPDPDLFISSRNALKKKSQNSLTAYDLIDFCHSEGAIALLDKSGSYGTVVGIGDRNGRFLDELGLPIIDITHEHYARMVRLIDRGIGVEMEIEVLNTLIKDNSIGYNVFAEIIGSDKTLKDEIVMFGAHIDSWHAGTGGNDNGSGVIVMMEVMRIIKESGLKPKRTIRLALWGGEEQGLLGSRNWANSNLFDLENNKKKHEFSKISAYYNFDYGTGRIRGIFLNNNLALKPIFEDFFRPLDDLGVRHTSMRSPGGSDHITFNRIGIPGFAFIQDRIDYGRSYHTNMDTFERIQLGDLKQAAVVLAALVYQTANYPEKLPRKDVVP